MAFAVDIYRQSDGKLLRRDNYFKTSEGDITAHLDAARKLLKAWVENAPDADVQSWGSIQITIHREDPNLHTELEPEFYDDIEDQTTEQAQ